MFVRFDDTYIESGAVVSVEKSDFGCHVSLSNGHVIALDEEPRMVVDRLVYANRVSESQPEHCFG